MKRKIIFLTLLTSLVITLSGCDTNQSTTAPFVVDVDFVSSSVDQYLLKEEKLDFSSSYFVAKYNDGNTATVSFDESYVSYEDESFGSNTCYITFTYESNDYYFDFDYYVFENNNERSLVKSINDLPYLNNLTTDNVNQVVYLLNSLSELPENDASFLNTYFPHALERLEKTEYFLIDLYYKEKTKELSQLYRTLNFGSYSEDALHRIEQYIGEFTDGEYTSLTSIIQTYNLTVYNVKSVGKINVPINEYRSNTIESLVNQFSVNYGTVIKNEGSGNPYIYQPIEKNYLEDSKFASFVSEFSGSIGSLESTSEIDKLYIETYNKIESAILGSVKEDAIFRINKLFEETKEIERELVESWDDITISVFVLNEDGSKSGYLFTDIRVDYLNDNRWWTPEPYKPGVILEKTIDEINNLNNVSDIAEKYKALEMEIMRSTLERDLELYYSIWRNYNPAYDTNDTLYWNNVATYWGDTVDRQFEYDGPLTEYVGQFFGSSSNNQFRLVDQFYNKNSHSYKNTPTSLLEEYFKIKTIIKPADLAIKSISLDLSNLKVEYEKNEPVDLTGGVINITYNDTKKEQIPMNNSMIVGTVDTSTIGSHRVNIEFTDPRLNEIQQAYFDIVVLSGGAYDTLVVKLASLDSSMEITDTTLPLIKEVVDIFNSLSPETQNEFMSSYPTEYAKLQDLERKAAPYYFEDASLESVSNYEKLNLYVYDNSSITAIEDSYSALLSTKDNALTFGEIDNAVMNFEGTLANAKVDGSLSLEQYKAKTIQSFDRVVSVDLYGYSGTNNNISLNSISKNLKDSITNYNDELSSINACTSIDGINTLYSSTITNFYETALSLYVEEATNNVKQAIFDLRATVSQLWGAPDNDIIKLNGESGSEWTTNYLDDGGYYCWYTPNFYQTGFLHDNVKVGDANTKRSIKTSYEFCLYDISRCTMWRNILTLYCYYGFVGPFWNYATYSTKYAYDGCISSFNNTIIGTGATTSYRLWYDGFNPTDRQTNLSGLLERYNIDIAAFIA